jgi:WD40 repeat protein
VEVKRIAHLTGHNGSVYVVKEGETKHLILSGAGDGWVVQWDLVQPEVGRLIAKADVNIFSLCFIKQKQLLLLGDMNGGLHWIPVHSPTEQKNISHHKLGIFDIHHIDNELFTLGGDGILTKWNVEKQKSTDSVQLSKQSLRAMAYAPQRNEIAIASSDRNIYILDRTSLALKNVIEAAHGNSVFCIAYSPDEKQLLSGGRDALLKKWDIENAYANALSIPAHLYTINAICFHPEGHLFATASRDKTIKIWKSDSCELVKVVNTIRNGCHINSINSLFWSSYNNWLISSSDDKSLMVWEIIGD